MESPQRSEDLKCKAGLTIKRATAIAFQKTSITKKEKPSLRTPIDRSLHFTAFQSRLRF